MSYTIRKATPGDFQSIFLLIKEFAVFQKTADKVTVTPEQMQQDEGLFNCFVARDNYGNIVGFASYFFAYYSWSGKALNLDDLYVKANHRKQGVGKLLLAAIIGLAKENNCKKVRWQVSKWNDNAIAFYKNIGASVDDTEINCDLLLQ